MRCQVALLLSACVLLSGCGGLPYPREMGDTALLRTMGVDAAEENLSLTVSTGPRAKGQQGAQEEALVLSAMGDCLSGAALSLQGLSDRYVFFGYVDQLLMGEALARQGVTGVLDYFARDTQLGLGARLWVVRGDTAHSAVRAGGEDGVDARLSTLEIDGEMGVATLSRTAGEVYSDLLEQGAAYLPALSPAVEQGQLREQGYAILKGDALVGFLEGDSARALELLVGKPAADTLTVELDGAPVTVRVTGAAVTCSFETLGKEVGLRLHIKVVAQLAQYGNTPNQEQIKQLGEALAQREARRVGEAMRTLQRWGADCVGLGARAGLLSPRLWNEMEGEWHSQFATVIANIKVEAIIRR